MKLSAFFCRRRLQSQFASRQSPSLSKGYPGPDQEILTIGFAAFATSKRAAPLFSDEDRLQRILLKRGSAEQTFAKPTPADRPG